MGSSEEEAAFALASAGGDGGRQSSAPVKRVRLSDLYSDSRVATEPLQPQVGLEPSARWHAMCTMHLTNSHTT